VRREHSNIVDIGYGTERVLNVLVDRKCSMVYIADMVKLLWMHYQQSYIKDNVGLNAYI